MALRNLRLFSARSGANAVFTADSLNPGQNRTFNASYTAPLDTCVSTDTLTLVAEDVCAGRSVTNIIATACPLITAPRLELTQQCPVVAPAPGAPLNYSGTIRNTGNVTLTNVIIVSDMPAPNTVVFRADLLAPGATANYSGSFTAPADTCAVTTRLNATSQNACGGADVATSSSATCPIATAPRIVITRNCPADTILAGSILTYSGTIQNTGNVTLTKVVIVSDRPAPNTVIATIATLAPGATSNYTGSYTTTVDTCSTTDTVTVTDRDVCSNQTASDTKTGTCPLRASGSVLLAIACPTTAAQSGGTITYSGTVTNPGDVTLNNIIVVNDAAPGVAVFTLATLAPKASANFNVNIPAPANVCDVTTSFSVTASERCGTGGIRDSRSATCPVSTAPAIIVTHDCPTVSPAPGETATYAGSVRNSGNVSLKDVVVRNGTATVFGPVSLEPGASASFTGTYTAPADVCSVTTSLTATAQDVCENRTVTNTSTKECAVKTTPAFTLTKECPTTPVAAGALITYTGLLRNTGNVTLNDVVVTSGNDRVFGPITLAPGATATVTSSVRAPENACNFTDTWVATAKDKCSTTTVTQNAAVTCPVATTPRLNVTLACPNENVTPGSTIRYAGVVSNPGTITLTNIQIVNDTDPTTVVFTVASLAPNASANFTVNVAAPADSCSVITSVTATATGQCEGAVTQKASATCPVTTAPALTVTHSCPVDTTLLGFVSTYTGRVSNTGNVTLTNVVVVNSLSGTTPVFGPAPYTHLVSV